MQRKLTVILSADVAGYSGLMEADDAGTLARLKANRSAIFDPCVATYGGRTIKLMGDGALVEFPSVVAAVECALAIQEATRQAEPDRAADTRIRYRIGINLGEVIVEADDLYGDGVNVAARLQALAPVDGHCRVAHRSATRPRARWPARSRTLASTPSRTSSVRCTFSRCIHLRGAKARSERTRRSVSPFACCPLPT
jgi:class 3 adenylate cyclase